VLVEVPVMLSVAIVKRTRGWYERRDPVASA